MPRRRLPSTRRHPRRRRGGLHHPIGTRSATAALHAAGRAQDQPPAPPPRPPPLSSTSRPTPTASATINASRRPTSAPTPCQRTSPNTPPAASSAAHVPPGSPTTKPACPWSPKPSPADTASTSLRTMIEPAGPWHHGLGSAYQRYHHRADQALGPRLHQSPRLAHHQRRKVLSPAAQEKVLTGGATGATGAAATSGVAGQRDGMGGSGVRRQTVPVDGARCATDDRFLRPGRRRATIRHLVGRCRRAHPIARLWAAERGHHMAGAGRSARTAGRPAGARTPTHRHRGRRVRPDQPEQGYHRSCAGRTGPDRARPRGMDRARTPPAPDLRTRRPPRPDHQSRHLRGGRGAPRHRRRNGRRPGDRRLAHPIRLGNG